MAGKNYLMDLDDVLGEIDASDWNNGSEFSSDDDSDLEPDTIGLMQAVLQHIGKLC